MIMIETDEVKVSPDIKLLAETTRKAMYLAIEQCRPGTKYNVIGRTIEEYARANGYYVNEEFGGHGIAHNLHMPPLIHHYAE